MGNGSMQIKNYITKKGYFYIKDYDKMYGGDYWFVIEPLHGWENKRFFYVQPIINNKKIYEITGEGHFLTKKYFTQHLKELRKELESVDVIYYYFTDDSGQILYEETSPLVKKSN